MPDALLHTNKPSLAYAKLVATPNASSWSQVYNAGNLFACLSLIAKDDASLEDEDLSLHALGKDIFNIFESEFFSLEEKNTTSIKKAIRASLEKAPPSVAAHLSLAVFKENILSVFIAGSGKIIMKRRDTIDVLLEQTGTDHTTVASASGYLQNNDTIVLETEQFANDIADETVAVALDLVLPNDIAEALSPQIHEKDDGGQAAIVIVYHGVEAPQQQKYTPHKEEIYEEREEEEDEVLEEAPHRKPLSLPSFSALFSKIPLPSLPFGRFNHRKRLFLNIAVVLIVLLTASIYLTIKKQADDKRHKIFQTIYPPAEKLYDEGKGIQDLNPALSRENFQKAENILTDGKTGIQPNTAEAQKIDALLAKIKTELGNTKTVKGLPTKEIAAAKDSLLGIEKANPTGLAFGQTDSAVFMITTKAVTSIEKTTGNKKDVITNDSDWEAPQAIVPYQGNIYILDQKKGVLKYVPSGGGYTKSAYFQESPDLSKATSMTIDGSVWIANNGVLFKYTKGESDGLKVKGLQKPLSNQVKLFTSLDITNLYVLDKGNSRVVKLTKDGSFQSEYPASVIATAKDFAVDEQGKKISILSQDKVYELEMK